MIGSVAGWSCLLVSVSINRCGLNVGNVPKADFNCTSKDLDSKIYII